MITIVKLKKIKMSFISKPENFKVPVAGGYMYLNGYLSIDRDNPRNAIKTIKKEAENIKNGISVYVNPEGTRSKTGLLLPIKPGAFKIATLSHAPIVVATFKNTRQIHKNFPKKTVVYHDILKVIPYEEYKDLNTHEIAAMVEKIMRDNGIE